MDSDSFNISLDFLYHWRTDLVLRVWFHFSPSLQDYVPTVFDNFSANLVPDAQLTLDYGTLQKSVSLDEFNGWTAQEIIDTPSASIINKFKR